MWESNPVRATCWTRQLLIVPCRFLTRSFLKFLASCYITACRRQTKSIYCNSVRRTQTTNKLFLIWFTIVLRVTDWLLPLPGTTNERHLIFPSIYRYYIVRDIRLHLFLPRTVCLEFVEFWEFGNSEATLSRFWSFDSIHSVCLYLLPVMLLVGVSW